MSLQTEQKISRSMLGSMRSTGKLFVAVLVLIINGVSGCKHEEEKEEVIRPVLSVLATKEVNEADGYTGTIEPRYQTDFSFRLLGKIIARDVNVGDAIKSGQRLAAIDPDVQAIAVRSAEASVANAIAQRDNAKNNLDRQKRSLEKGATTESDYDLAQKSYENMVSDVAQANTNLDKAKEELSYTELPSDIDGVVTKVLAEKGQTVSAGQPIATVANPALREGVVDIGEDIIHAIKPGTEFRIVLQTSPDFQVVGKVREIAPQAEAKTRTRRVRIAIDNPPEGLRLGSTITAYPESIASEDIRLPVTAILDQDNSSYVWIVDEKSNTVNRVAVTVSRRYDSFVSVSNGVKSGDRVVIAGVHSLSVGQKINWNPEDIL